MGEKGQMERGSRLGSAIHPFAIFIFGIVVFEEIIHDMNVTKANGNVERCQPFSIASLCTIGI